mmetsp:Transcript_1883/g.2236  ORF Transcript_1883/g.2236 Transcript_1883/m.2236 type:complete len:225 (+) Transcript_1883:3-677(+)|eukprot:CAMPEP_0204624308 /NCGR_PEP_ID=MMETSP0717-20131115/10057_1 /ASSEMBLY_ACC=CAM_ASM_000666 /TAXON_ID=230516 /ORGANISM="Chaetoceros curvisetus" /LENGTH=224 /DNA_ID=CAMNT_0051639655 /DNA_START=9 /DNA_END=683 /DNA_ORIENTATION=+
MASSLDLDEEVTDVPLSPTPATPATATATPSASIPNETIPAMTTNTNENDPLTPPGGEASKNEEEDLNVDELLDELEEPTETDIAVKELKESTLKLTSAIKSVGSDIDHRLNITESARGLDSQLGVTRTVSSTASSIGRLWGDLQITERASSLVNNDVVKGASETMRGTLETTGVKGVWESQSQKLKNLDQEHHLSTTAVGTLSSGMNWLTGQIKSHTGHNEDK